MTAEQYAAHKSSTVSKSARICWNKKRFTSIIQAAGYAGKLRAHYPENKLMKPYECPLCGGAHLASV